MRLTKSTTRNRVFKFIKQNPCRLNKRRYRVRVVSDELKKLRASYEAQIIALQEKIQRLDQVEKDAKPFSKSRYSSYGLTDAVLDALAEMKRRGLVPDSGVAAGQVRDFVGQYGMTMTHNFNVSLHVTLERLADSGRIKAIKSEGKKRYAPKDE